MFRFLFGIALLACTPAFAGVRIAADTVRTPEVLARGIELKLDTTNAGATRLRLELASVQPGASPSAWTRVVFSGVLERRGDAWACPGRLTARAGSATIDAALTLSSERDAALATLEAGAARFSIGGTQAQRRFTAHALPVTWLQPLVATLLGASSATGGTLDADLARSRARLEGSFALHALDLDSTDGALAAGKLDADGRIAIGSDATSVSAALRAGEWLVAPFYVKLDATPIAIEALLRDGGKRLERFRWRDPGALAFDAEAQFDVDGVAQSATIDRIEATFPAAFDRYFAPVLAPSGYGELSTAGSATARIDWQVGSEPQLTLAAPALDISDRGGRFAIAHLALDLAVNRARTEPSTIAWDSARLYRVPLGAARAALDLAPRRWQLNDALAIPALGGQLRLERLTRTLGADATARWEGAVGADALSIELLSAALDWPRFTGALDARVPAFHYDGQEIRLDGALSIDAFGGKAAITEVALERPFGVAPSFAAQVRFDDIDLGELTGALSFGRIDGKLDGDIRDLRLVDWSPVRFDARFRTDDAYRGEKRISQRAVKNLSLVGGGGGVQAGILKVFESFGYDAIGLSCRLELNVCHMGGLEEEGAQRAAGAGGYTIVRGAGLPRLTILGHQRAVDWPVLLARLRTATQTGPIVQ